MSYGLHSLKGGYIGAILGSTIGASKGILGLQTMA